MYEDIINLKRPDSKRIPMSRENRAAQFSPFAALTGYDESIKETSRITKDRVLIDENRKEILDFEINKILENIKINKISEVEITYFQKDNKKEGGDYKKERGIVKKIATNSNLIVMQSEKIISIMDIIDIKECD